MNDIKATATKLISEIDASELACRITEGITGTKRPDGATAAEALRTLDADSYAGAFRAAKNAVCFIAECIAKGSVPS